MTAADTPATGGSLAHTRIVFVGAGNMAEALIGGLLESGRGAADRIRASDLAEARCERLQSRYGIKTARDNAELAPWGELVVLAVKPQVMDSVLGSIREAVAPDATVVSIAAGVSIAQLEAGLRSGARVVRAMPNAPAMVRAGATAIAPGQHAGEQDLRLAEALFEAVGSCVRVSEPLLDAVTGLSGSGPAYVMLIIDALADGGVKMGLTREVAQQLAVQTVYGAAKLQIETGEHPAALKDRVTSPGGTTSAGLAALEASAVRSALIQAVDAATRRARELGEEH